MKAGASPIHHLELRVRELGQLFNSMDSTPFLNKDLDREAEAFIETWAMGLPTDSRLHLTIHLEHLPAEGDPGALVTEAVHNHFAYKADRVRGDLNDLFRQDRATTADLSLRLVAAGPAHAHLSRAQAGARSCGAGQMTQPFCRVNGPY